jgi:enoyl-[acyl-carrier-protein] reductase (NADH)
LPLGHTVTPEQVASTTLELLTNEAITGQVVALDSGGLLP